MEITYEEYKQECLDDIHLEAQIDGTTYDDYFLTDTLGKLVAMGELIDPQPLCVNKKEETIVLCLLMHWRLMSRTSRLCSFLMNLRILF